MLTTVAWKLFLLSENFSKSYLLKSYDYIYYNYTMYEKKMV